MPSDRPLLNVVLPPRLMPPIKGLSIEGLETRKPAGGGSKKSLFLDR
jgi:hypothetical protein